MKRRLFWKILFAFWLTFLLITEGVWLLLIFIDAPHKPRESRLEQLQAGYVLDAASSALHFGGEAGLQALLQTWPATRRAQLQRVPLSQALPARAFAREVSLPDGSRQRLQYQPDIREMLGPLPGPFDFPPPMLWLCAVFGLLFSAALAWHLTRPVQVLRAGFARLAKGEFATRLQPGMGGRRDEIADLAADFDSMATQLEQLVRSREQLLHDVSHELRSPLARLHVAAELARSQPQRVEETLARIEAEAHRLDELVGSLLALSRIESGAPVLDDYFDLAGLVLHVISDARFEALRSGVQIATNLEDNGITQEWPILRGSTELMRRSLDNLLRNALRFSSAAQCVRVDLTMDAAADELVLEVSDQGPGVAPDVLEHIFEPFVRGESGSTGFGLGLSIVRRAIIAHGGRVSARNGDSGGLSVCVRLPCAGRSQAAALSA
ncbi:sensor histidine kinase [Uliginosibacterium sediminicola]|uniref:Signal transduction histidine-protein kinase/phosphatase MprB n=1 Tax=Uliginosibacterium sediminicola TaxID=2024550 RepID=A0ABU9YUE8_9RHOO